MQNRAGIETNPITYLKRQFWKFSLPLFSDNTYFIFLVLSSKNFFHNLGEMMVYNIVSLLTVRMQNVDYKNNRNLRAAIKDLFLIDKHRMLYRGLVPMQFGFSNLKASSNFIEVYLKNNDTLASRLLWPLIFLGGTLLAHPLFLIGMRVQCSPFSPNPKRYSNMWSCINHILSTKGKMGFY